MVMTIIRCPNLDCKAEIAVDEKTVYPIDCDCGTEISREQTLSLAENIKAHGEVTQKIIDAVKASPGTYAETIENAVGDYMKWWTIPEIEATYPELFTE